MPKISKIIKETEQLTELVHENVPLHDQSCSGYSNAPFISMIAAFCVVYITKISNTFTSLKQASNDGLE